MFEKTNGETTMFQKNGWFEADKNYWKQYGWDKNNRPWKEG